MHFNRNLLFGKGKYLFGLLLLLFIATITVAFSSADDSAFTLARREVLLRQIGHELLSESGDATSRVLPIQKIAENEYRITFENEFTFQPDALMNITQRLLVKDPLASEYVVNVLNCSNADLAYGFAVSKNKTDNIITCVGRNQPKACYIITIKFKPNEVVAAKKEYWLGGLSVLALVGFVFLGVAKPRKVAVQKQTADEYVLGAIVFDVKNKQLLRNGIATDLTATETRVFHIFAAAPNEMIERNRLQKEIWEDEGVIVGRSLDMFISKLRKKLELDPNVKITVIRGKGYRLDIF